MLCTLSDIPTIWSPDDVSNMTELYNQTFLDLLNSHAPVRTINYRERASNVWFDDDYRNAKAHVRSLERRYRLTTARLDRSLWVEGLARLYALYHTKQNLVTSNTIEEHKDNPR